jgi:hypothetical protein
MLFLFEIVGHHYPLADIVFCPCRILLYFGEYCFALVGYQYPLVDIVLG